MEIMELQRILHKLFILMSVVISIDCRASGTWSRDKLDVTKQQSQNGELLLSETIQTMLSATASLFVDVATSGILRRLPRQAPDNSGCGNEVLCGSDGKFYSNLCSLTSNNAQVLPTNTYCETGCGGSLLTACTKSKKIPVCAGSGDKYLIYEDECELNMTRCHMMEKLADVDQVFNLTEIVTIGKCQKEAAESQLTCYDILRGRCPHGTMGGKVCDLKNKKNYRNACRVLHRRCKHEEEFCYNYDDECPKTKKGKDIQREKRVKIDCSEYILDYSVRSSKRTCYIVSSRSDGVITPEPNCTCTLSTLPGAPLLPNFIANAAKEYELKEEGFAKEIVKV